MMTVIILGDMLELGESSDDMHVGQAPSLVNNQSGLVFAFGTFMTAQREKMQSRPKLKAIK